MCGEEYNYNGSLLLGILREGGREGGSVCMCVCVCGGGGGTTTMVLFC